MLFAQYFYDSTAYKRQTSLLSAFDVANVRLNGALREREEVQERTNKYSNNVAICFHCLRTGRPKGGGGTIVCNNQFIRTGRPHGLL